MCRGETKHLEEHQDKLWPRQLRKMKNCCCYLNYLNFELCLVLFLQGSKEVIQIPLMESFGTEDIAMVCSKMRQNIFITPEGHLLRTGKRWVHLK